MSAPPALLQAFNGYDKDGDQTITWQELADFRARNYGMTPDEVRDQGAISAGDKDGSGTMDINEFGSWLAAGMANQDAASCQDSYRTFDIDGNGYVTAAEMKTSMAGMGTTLTDEEAQAKVQELDIDGNEGLNFEEFCKTAAIDASSNTANTCTYELQTDFSETYDKDNDGLVTQEELKTAMAGFGVSLPDDAIKARLDLGDTNGDGKWSPGEFCKTMQLTAKQRLSELPTGQNTWASAPQAALGLAVPALLAAFLCARRRRAPAGGSPTGAAADPEAVE